VRHEPAVVATGYDIAVDIIAVDIAAGRMTLKWQPGITRDPEKCVERRWLSHKWVRTWPVQEPPPADFCDARR
jgi:hypothetical protein